MTYFNDQLEHIQLFCLPFAGGSYYSYNTLEKYLSEQIRCIPIDLPGHGRRMKEPLLRSLKDMRDDIYGRIMDQLDPPYAFFGHSMGATLGYLLIQKIVSEKKPLPLHLFASGRQGPPVPSSSKIAHLLPKPEFIAHLTSYGGLPDELLKEQELLDLFEPILRADFEAIGTYEYQPAERLPIPISVFLGINDTTSVSQALTWQEVTEHRIGLHQFPGGHFFIFDNMSLIGRLISEKMLSGHGVYRADTPDIHLGRQLG